VAVPLAAAALITLPFAARSLSGALIDAGWFLGYVLILFAARKAASTSAGRWSPATWTAWSATSSPWPGRPPPPPERVA
jgi:hypothetical protein